MGHEEEIQLEKLKKRKRWSMNGRRWLVFALFCAGLFILWNRVRIAPLPAPPEPPQPLCPGENAAADLRNAAAEFAAGEFEQALALARPLADAGCPPALVLLAGMHSSGFGLPKDQARAAALYEQAASAGYAPALVALGDSFYSGNGLPQDLKKAYAAYGRAAELDGGLGLWAATAMLEKGGFEPDGGLAAQYAALVAAARKHAESGSVSSELFLGQLYENGRLGQKTDMPQAYLWYSRAAEAGNGYAAWRAALMCHYGRGIRNDYPVAARWYALAARRGESHARWNLAFMLAHGGPGVERSWLQALRWIFFGPPRGVRLRVQGGPLAGSDRHF
ncbi:MAG TPA: tetratricopeptide repeat protein [Elusimicrobiales bacterium]|nr:tetratricopeptide repeat protein [Elusimicrobiales bacterium]